MSMKNNDEKKNVTINNAIISILGVLWWISIWGFVSDIIQKYVDKYHYVVYLLLGITLLVVSRTYNIPLF